MKKEEKKISATATRLFTSQGIRNISVEEIMRRVGLSKRTFYECFESKEMLVDMIIADGIEKSERYLSMNRYISSNAISEIINFSRSMEKMAQTIRPLFFHELRKYYANSWDKLEKFREDTLTSFLIQQINRGLSEEIYRHNMDVPIAVNIYITQLQMVATHLWMPGMEMDKLLREMNTFFLHGLVNAKGLKLLYDRRPTAI